MTFVATKLPHYILFLWPALALAVAERSKPPRKASWRRSIVAGCGAASISSDPWPAWGWRPSGRSVLAAPARAIVPFWGRRPCCWRCPCWRSAAIAGPSAGQRDHPPDRRTGIAAAVTLGILPALEEVKIAPALAGPSGNRHRKRCPSPPSVRGADGEFLSRAADRVAGQ